MRTPRVSCFESLQYSFQLMLRCTLEFYRCTQFRNIIIVDSFNENHINICLNQNNNYVSVLHAIYIWTCFCLFFHVYRELENIQ